MAKIFRKMRNPYVLCAITHSLTLKVLGMGPLRFINGRVTVIFNKCFPVGAITL